MRRTPAFFRAHGMTVRISTLGIEVWGLQWTSLHKGRRSCSWGDFFSWLWSRKE